MIRTLVVSLAALAAATSHAAPIVTVTAGPGSDVPGVCSLDFDGSSCAGVSFSGGQVRSGSVGGVAARPPGSTGNYLAVGPGNGGAPAVFGVANPDSMRYNYVGFLAGSLDDYNAITFQFVDGTGTTQSYSGTELADLAGVPANGDQGVSRYFNVTLPDGYYSAFSLVSTSNAFEVDNLALGAAAVGKVPLPGTLALLGVGLLGVGASRRR